MSDLPAKDKNPLPPKRRGLRLAAYVAAGSVGAAFGLARWQLRRYAVRRLAYVGRQSSEETPAFWDLPFEEVWFNSRDGLRLHGWFIPLVGENNNPQRPTIILGHGYSGHKVPDLALAQVFHRAGYKVFMFDFRGHGLSEGPRGTSMAYMERLDVHGAVDYLLGRGERRLAMYGLSMGASIGIIATAENPHISALIADSAFAHLWRSISAEMKNQGWPRPLTNALAHFAYKALSDHHGYPYKQGHPANYVAKIAPRPILFIHGDQDGITLVENSYILYGLAGEPKKLWILPGFGHAEAFSRARAEFEKRVLDFLAGVNWPDPKVLADQARWAELTANTTPI